MNAANDCKILFFHITCFSFTAKSIFVSKSVPQDYDLNPLQLIISLVSFIQITSDRALLRALKTYSMNLTFSEKCCIK